jgi:oligoribonuclease (3'-5' exoribonuclease)
VIKYVWIGVEHVPVQIQPDQDVPLTEVAMIVTDPDLRIAAGATLSLILKHHAIGDPQKALSEEHYRRHSKSGLLRDYAAGSMDRHEAEQCFLPLTDWSTRTVVVGFDLDLTLLVLRWQMPLLVRRLASLDRIEMRSVGEFVRGIAGLPFPEEDRPIKGRFRAYPDLDNLVAAGRKTRDLLVRP